MAALFWIVTALDGLLFLVLLVATLTTRDIADGGREMSIIFALIVPGIVVASGVLLFTKSGSQLWRSVALLIVAGPGLLLGLTRLRSAFIDRQVRENAAGRGYFSGRDMKAAGAAVVQGDTAALRAAGRRVDVNARGEHGMTLMELAVTQAWEAPASTPNRPSPLAIIRELLALGADPNAGLEIATKVADASVIMALLDAGAKPDHANDFGPVVFEWLGVMPAANLAALLDHALDPNLVDRTGTPMIVAAAGHDRWDLVLLLLERGADAGRADASGTRLRDVIQSRDEPTMSQSAEAKAAIDRVRARLSTRTIAR